MAARGYSDAHTRPTPQRNDEPEDEDDSTFTTMDQRLREVEIRRHVARNGTFPFDEHGKPKLFVDEEECPVCKSTWLSSVAVFHCGHFMCAKCYQTLVDGAHQYHRNHNHCLVCKENTPPGDVVVFTLSTSMERAHQTFVGQLAHANAFASSHSTVVCPVAGDRVIRYGIGTNHDTGRIAYLVDVPPAVVKADASLRFVSILFDISGSMGGVIDALHRFKLFDRLMDGLVGSVVSLTVFDNKADSVVEPVLITPRNVDDVKRRLSSIKSRGGTTLHKGLQRVIDVDIPDMFQVARYASVGDAPSGVVSVFIITDGATSELPTAVEEMNRLRSVAEMRVDPFVLGVGDGYSFDSCDALVGRDVTKYEHVTDVSALFDRITGQVLLSHLQVNAITDHSHMFYNGNVTSPTHGKTHSIVLRPAHDAAAENTRVCFTDVDICSVRVNNQPATLVHDGAISFDIVHTMISTLAIVRVKDLSINVGLMEMYERMRMLKMTKKALQPYRGPLGEMFNVLVQMIDGQMAIFEHQVVESDRAPYQARYRSDAMDARESSNATARMLSAVAVRSSSAPGYH